MLSPTLWNINFRLSHLVKPAKISFSSSHLILLAPYFTKKTVVIRRELLHVSRYHLLIPTRTLCLFFSFNRPVFPNLLFISTPFKESLYIYIFSNCAPPNSWYFNTTDIPYICSCAAWISEIYIYKEQEPIFSSIGNVCNGGTIHAAKPSPVYQVPRPLTTLRTSLLVIYSLLYSCTTISSFLLDHSLQPTKMLYVLAY